MRLSLLDKTADVKKMRQPAAGDLAQDLNLSCVLKAMAQNDDFIYRTSEEVMLNSLADPEDIVYRQEILRDCMDNASSTQRLYSLAAKAVYETAKYKENTKPNYTRVVSATTRVAAASKLLDILITNLRELKAHINGCRYSYRSKAMEAFFGTLNEAVSDKFLTKARALTSELQNLGKEKIILGARLGFGLRGAGYVLRSISSRNAVADYLKSKLHKSATIELENIGIAKSAKDFQEASLMQVLKIINRFSENIIRFFEDLRYQIGFYAGCINLSGELKNLRAPISFPMASDAEERIQNFKGLYDLSLALQDKNLPISNDIETEEKRLFIVTGANQGGKSTYLRSIGLAQLMMQCGMFVPASEFRANVCDHIFTHFTRGEDVKMNSGKLDQELSRMNIIISAATKNSLILMNESFATTTEREGSRIAMDILLALYELRIKTVFVTHLFEFANDLYGRKLENAIFLRAERQDKGERTFRIIPGKPLHTSYGEDLYNAIIEEDRSNERFA